VGFRNGVRRSGFRVLTQRPCQGSKVRRTPHETAGTTSRRAALCCGPPAGPGLADGGILNSP
jgi:hypothetical protein